MGEGQQPIELDSCFGVTSSQFQGLDRGIGPAHRVIGQQAPGQPGMGRSIVHGVLQGPFKEGLCFAVGGMLSALKWVVRDPSVHSTIPSMTDMDQLDENLKAMSEPYGATDQKLLGARLEFIRPFYCRMCGQCDGQCRQGLPVADMLRFVTYADGYGQDRKS